MKGLLNKLFGFRWSLYVCRDGKNLRYAMHEHSVIRMLGYVMNEYKDHGNPKPPWSIWLNFNKTNTAFELRREHFTPDGEYLSPKLLTQIESIDPKYRVRGGEPIAIDVGRNRRMPISRNIDLADLQSYIDNKDKAKSGMTFLDVLAELFDHGLENVEIVIDIEGRFGIEISDDRAMQIMTVGQMHQEVVSSLVASGKADTPALREEVWRGIVDIAAEHSGTIPSLIKPESGWTGDIT